MKITVRLLAVLLLLVLAAGNTIAQDPKKESETAAINAEKLKILKKERATLDVKMFKTRIYLIKSDRELAKIHDDIMYLHKKLAILLDRKPQMKRLAVKSRQLDEKIKELTPKKDGKKK